MSGYEIEELPNGGLRVSVEIPIPEWIDELPDDKKQLAATAFAQNFWCEVKRRMIKMCGDAVVDEMAGSKASGGLIGR